MLRFKKDKRRQLHLFVFNNLFVYIVLNAYLELIEPDLPDDITTMLIYYSSVYSYSEELKKELSLFDDTNIVLYTDVSLVDYVRYSRQNILLIDIIDMMDIDCVNNFKLIDLMPTPPIFMSNRLEVNSLESKLEWVYQQKLASFSNTYYFYTEDNSRQLFELKLISKFPEVRKGFKYDFNEILDNLNLTVITHPENFKEFIENKVIMTDVFKSKKLTLV